MTALLLGKMLEPSDEVLFADAIIFPAVLAVLLRDCHKRTISGLAVVDGFLHEENPAFTACRGQHNYGNAGDLSMAFIFLL